MTPMRERAAKVAEELRKAIWERIEKRIEEQPIDGISAGNEFSEVIRAEQRGIVVGLRGARLSAISTVANFDFDPNHVHGCERQGRIHDGEG